MCCTVSNLGDTETLKMAIVVVSYAYMAVAFLNMHNSRACSFVF